MRRRILTVVFTGVLLTSPFMAVAEKSDESEGTSIGDERIVQRKEWLEERRQEREAYRKKVKGKSFSERRAALKASRNANSPETRAVQAQQHEQNLKLLKKKIADNSSLTDSEKKDLVEYYDKLYKDYKAVHNKAPAENMIVVEKIVNSPSLPVEERKNVLKHYVQEGVLINLGAGLASKMDQPVPQENSIEGDSSLVPEEEAVNQAE